ncbi:MAG: BrnT family toxin [Fibrobacter sp.]|nr:BrnT family toxin [Fibrobacter sp.]
MQIEFVWDQKKNETNRKKHGVSFEEAKTCFKDDYAKVFFDAEHIVNRIISARKATKKENQYYWNERKGICS